MLPRAFYARPTLTVARELIGLTLVHTTAAGRVAGVIVEVEAYVGENDPACHAASGLTTRNAPLYGRPGRAYVYLNYGIHHLVNAVTEPEGVPAAVLLRAVEPREGLELMRRRRRATRPTSVTKYLNAPELCRGPGNLSCAFGISLTQNRSDLCGGPLSIEDRGDLVSSGRVVWSNRIGIRVGTDRRWRCYLGGCASVSA
jgi:DNA-3-methyladenine glycosylase